MMFSNIFCVSCVYCDYLYSIVMSVKQQDYKDDVWKTLEIFFTCFYLFLKL